MKTIYVERIPIEEALNIEPAKNNCLRWELVDRAWEKASQAVPNFRTLDDAGDVGEATVRRDGDDFVVTVHDLRAA